MTYCNHITLRASLLLAVVLLLSACGSLPSAQKVIQVKGQYLDLKGRSVAVVVSTSDHTAFSYPEARPLITREITRRIKANVDGVTVTDPNKVLQWQDDNPYWATRPPSSLVRQLEVERLVLVEIGEYRTHEPGDKHVLRGVISATINVVEAEAADPDNFGASFTKNVLYPEAGKSKIGRVAVSEQQVEFKTQIYFCEEAAGLFFDHQLIR